jgi:hypothetical protein
MAYNWINATIFNTSYDIDEGQSIYATDSDNIFIVFNDWNEGLSFSKSTNGGVSWSTPLVIDANYGINLYGRHIWVSSDKQTIYVTYQSESGATNVMFTKSTDGGSTFSSPVAIDDLSDSCFEPSIAVYGNYIYVAYFDNNVVPQMRLAVSSNGGTSWTNKKIQDGAGGNDVDIRVLDENTVFVVGNMYQSGRPNNLGLVLSKSINNGDSWTHYLVTNVGDIGWDQSLYVKDINNIYISFSKAFPSDNLNIAVSSNGGSDFDIAVIDSSGGPNYNSSIGSPNGTLVMISYLNYNGNQEKMKVAYSTNGTDWTLEDADTFRDCGYDTSMAVVSDYVFIAHGTRSTYCIRFTKSPIATSLPISSILMYKFRPVVLT